MNSLNPLCTMKTNKLIAAALLPLLFSCAKENIEPSIKGETFDISITVSPDDDTKAIFDDAEGVLWINPASAGLVTSEWDTVVAQKSTAATVSDDNRQATFTFAGITAGTYRLFYPYVETYYPNLKFTVAANQTQDAGGKSSDIFAGMATEDITAIDGENNIVDVTYKAVGSYIQFLVYGKTGEKVRYISIVSSDSKIAGDYLVNAKDFKYTILEGGSDRVLVALVNDGYTTTESAENAKGIYASVLPGSSTNTYYVTTDNGVYSFKSSEAKTFNAGEIKTVKLNLDNASVQTETVPQELYIVGNVAYVGWNCANAKKMEKNGNVFSTDVYLSTQVKNSDNTISDAEGFKFLTQTVNWKIGYVKGTDGKLAYMSESNGVADTKFTVEKAGYYHVEANFDTKEVTCTPKAPEKLYVWGAATTAGWVSEKAIELTKSSENEFIFSIENIPLRGNEEFKFFSEHSESTAYVSDKDGYLVFFDSPTYSEVDRKFKVKEDGIYSLTVNLDANSVTWSKKTSFPQVYTYTGDNNSKVTTSMIFTELKDVYKAKVLIGKGSGRHDFKVFYNNNYYHVNRNSEINKYQDFSMENNWDANNSDNRKDNLEVSWSVISDTDEYGWYLLDDLYGDKYYDISLDLSDENNPQVKVKLSQGTKFYICADQWENWKPSSEQTINASGVVKWENIYCQENLQFNIKGENDNEYYFSTNNGSNYGLQGSWGDNYNKNMNVQYRKGDRNSWQFGEYGHFDIEFDTKNLTLKVTKK